LEPWGWSLVDDVACALVTDTRYNVACRLTCGCSSCIYFLLTMHSLCSNSVFSLYTLLIRLTSMRRYVGGDHKDLSIRELEHVTRIVGRDGHSSDLERETVRRWLTVDLAAMSRDERTTKLLEHTALASCVFGVLVGQGSSR
jgi:hypothetical protein